MRFPVSASIRQGLSFIIGHSDRSAADLRPPPVRKHVFHDRVGAAGCDQFKSFPALSPNGGLRWNLPESDAEGAVRR